MARHQMGSIVLISGDAGIGKTALARAIMHEASDSFLVATGRCFDWTSGAPYAPWLEIIGHTGAEAPRVHGLTDDATGDGADEVAAPEAMFARLLKALSDRAQEKPMILFIDDAHAADAASLELLRFLGYRIRDLPILAMVAYRSDELSRRHPLYTLIPALVREAEAKRLDLHSLPLTAIRELVNRRFHLGAQDGERLARYLIDRAEGNPFFIDEILRSLEDQDVLTRDDSGEWSLGSLELSGVPVLLQQVIESRLQQVPDRTRELLEVASLIGNEVSLELWQQTVEQDERELIGAAEEGLEAGILNETREAKIEFRHALIRETLYESVFPPRRRLWHRRIAEILEQTPNPDPDMVAYHFRQAEDPREATWLIRAGDRAWQAFARLEAGLLYDRALAVMGRGEPSDSDVAWLCLRLAEANRLAAPRQALEYLGRASELTGDGRDPLLDAMVLFSRGMILCLLDEPFGLDVLVAGDKLLDDLTAADRQRIWEIWRTDIDARKGEVAAWLSSYGRYHEAIEMAETYLGKVAGQAASRRRTEGDAWDAIGTSHAALGHPDQATPALERAVGRFIAQDNSYSAGVTLWEELIGVAIPYFAEDAPRRHALATRARELWTRARDAQIALNPDWAFTPVDFIEGNWDRAYESALGTLRSEAWSVGPLSFMARIARWRGDPDEAWARIFQAMPAGHEARPRQYPVYNTLILQQLGAELALDAGDLDTAERWLASNRQWLDETSRRLRRANLHTVSARLLLQKGEIVEAEKSALEAVRIAQSPRQALPLMIAERQLAEILRRQGRTDEATATIDSAISTAIACRMPYDQALGLLSRVLILIDTGKLVPIPATIREAREILLQLGATPALQQLEEAERRLNQLSPRISAPAGLSPREIEVLVLLSNGLTDAEIGVRLKISRRTVSNHVSSIYGKLGVSSRTAAARFAIEHDLS